MSLPENIENIEDFYRKNLADLEVPPPAGLWEEIKPHVPKGKAGLGSKGWGIASVSVVTVSVLVLWKSGVFNKNEKMEEVAVPISAPVQDKTITESTAKTTHLKPDIAKEEESARKKAPKLSIPSDQTNKVQAVESGSQGEALVEDPQIHTLPADPAPLEETHTPSIEEQNISFYEKMKSKSKDSLRPIFVPKK